MSHFSLFAKTSSCCWFPWLFDRCTPKPGKTSNGCGVTNDESTALPRPSPNTSGTPLLCCIVTKRSCICCCTACNCPSFRLPNMAMTSWICAAWGVKPPKVAPTVPLGMFPWEFIGFTPKFGKPQGLGPPGILAQPKLGTRACTCAGCCINVCCWGIHCAPNHAGPCCIPCITGMFQTSLLTTLTICIQVCRARKSLRTLWHICLLLPWLLLGHCVLKPRRNISFRCLSIHPRPLRPYCALSTLLTRCSRHRWQSSATTTTISLTSFSHTRTRTTLHALHPWIHTYYIRLYELQAGSSVTM